MPIFWAKRLAFIIILVSAISACSDSLNEATPSEQYQYRAAEYRDDGWETGHLADFEIDEKLITQLIRKIQDKTYPGIDSISIVRDNVLLLHEDFRTSFSKYDEWMENEQLDQHLIHSASKSFVSALVGIAIQQGYILDTQTPFQQFFDYSKYANNETRKQAITLEDVLTMRLGIKWDEWAHPFGDSLNSLTHLTENNRDYVKALLDLPMDSAPGSHYAYNTIASIALGLAIERATGIPLTEYAQQYLFNPLQIETAQWLMTPTNSANTGSGLFIKTRDMAKLGQLYLNQGVWNGNQIIDPEWIKESLKQHVKLEGEYTSGYGFQWWLGNFTQTQKNPQTETVTPNTETIQFYSARGYGGQYIIVLPSYQLIIAFTAQNYENDLSESPLKLVEKFILPAIQS